MIILRILTNTANHERHNKYKVLMYHITTINAPCCLNIRFTWRGTWGLLVEVKTC